MNAITKKLPTVARYLLGTIFFVFGLNGFLHFLPMPPLAGPSGDLMGAFLASGYLFPLIKGTEVLAGFALLSNRFAPLALVILAPITVNIVAFHAALAPAGIGLTLVVLAAHLGAAWGYRELYRPLLQARAPRTADAPSSNRSAVASATA